MITMYQMRTIVPINSSIDLPTCMYSIKNPMQELSKDNADIKICDQVMRFFKNSLNKNMSSIEERQDQLLKKLDKLYNQIREISSSYQLHENTGTNSQSGVKNQEIQIEEMVLVISSDNLPWFLKAFLKTNRINFTWHIHSSTPSNKIYKIQSFFEKLNVQQVGINDSRVNLRLIFKNVSARTELKTSTLGLPISGNVNVLRFLCEQYPNTTSYDHNDYELESLLDSCYLCENSPETKKQDLLRKFFQKNHQWIHGNQFTIVDLVVFNEVKQWQNYKKIVPMQWFTNCEKIMDIENY